MPYPQLESVEQRLRSMGPADYVPSSRTDSMVISGTALAKKRRRLASYLASAQAASAVAAVGSPRDYSAHQWGGFAAESGGGSGGGSRADRKGKKKSGEKSRGKNGHKRRGGGKAAVAVGEQRLTHVGWLDGVSLATDHEIHRRDEGGTEQHAEEHGTDNIGRV